MGNCVRSLKYHKNMAGLDTLRCFAHCPSGYLQEVARFRSPKFASGFTYSHVK